MDSELTNAWRLVGTMSKIKDLLIEQEIETENSISYADSCILIEKIINAYPDLGKSRALELALIEHISIEKATNKANMVLFKELAELFEPQSSGPCFEAYLNLKLINEDLSIAKEAIVEQYEREEYEASQGP